MDLLPNPHRSTISASIEETAAWASRQKRLVVADGVFDSLLPPELLALQHARDAGDALLVIALPCYGAVRFTPSARALRLASLKCVDRVHLVGDECDLIQVMKALPPAMFALTGARPKALRDWLHRQGWEPLDVWRSAHAAAAEFSWATEA